VTPIEAGLMFAVAWDKPGGFIGLEALMRARQEPRHKRILSFVVEDDSAMAWGGEPVMLNGEIVGTLSSAAWSFALQKTCGLGSITLDGMEGDGKML